MKTDLQHDTGLLWFDCDPRRDLADKIAQVARCYRQKFGTRPNLCYVHPSALSENDIEHVGGVEVRPRATVLAHHFWIGQRADIAQSEPVQEVLL